jgi:hypothetical protein
LDRNRALAGQPRSCKMRYHYPAVVGERHKESYRQLGKITQLRAGG